MKRHFKSKNKHKKTLLIYLVITLIIVITSINTTKYYINKIIKKEFVEDLLITDNNKYLDPNYILEYTIKYKEEPELEEEPINNDVYIYQTHDTEKYSSTNLEEYNIVPDVSLASSILKDKLNNYNINCYLEENKTTNMLKNNNWSYSYSYKASREIIENNINNNNYKLIIDLHRDSSNIDQTKLISNDISYAKILFVVGTDYNYEPNLNVANKLNEIITKNLPDLSRGIIKKGGSGVNGIYNQDLNPNMVLIEVGGEYNTIEDINNTMDILSISIKEYLEGEQ